MFDAIFKDLIRRGGRKLAEKHIKRALLDTRFGGQFDFEACKREVEGSYWRRKSYNFIFQRGYDAPWYQVGADDALKGARRFDEVSGYCIGWNLQVIAMTHSGWINPRLVQKYGIEAYGGKDFSGYVENLKHEVGQLEIE